MANLTDFYLQQGSVMKGPIDKSSMGKLMATGKVTSNSIIAFVPSGVRPRPKDLHKAKDFPLWNERRKYIRQTVEGDYGHVILTTESHSNLDISKRLGILTAECVEGMNIFRDLFAGVRDIVGGRSKTTQSVLRSIADVVLMDLSRQAHELGADAVVAIDLDYSEFSGGGKSMLICIASGTAVKLNTSAGVPESDEESHAQTTFRNTEADGDEPGFHARNVS